MDILIALLLCVVASLPAATSIKHSTWKPYSRTHHREDDHQYLYSHTNLQEDGLYDHMSGLLQPRSYSERTVAEGGFILLSMAAHSKKDIDALLSFRKAIRTDPYGKLSNWTAENSENICSWYGVRCRKNTTRVMAIDLHVEPSEESLTSEGALSGTLSSSLGNLSLLRIFNLSGNALNGGLPAEFGHLKALQVLDLTGNVISGSIPVELGLLQKLESLILEGNELSGNIPPVLGHLKALQVLDLSGNHISGSIPIELGLLQKLEYLHLEGNEFSGHIPHQLGNLTQLTQLSISGLNIDSSIPFEIFKLPLSSLFLGLNLGLNLTESIIKAIANMTKLTHLTLY